MKHSKKEDHFAEIGEEYRELILTIMQLCQVNAEEAFQKLVLNDFNVKKAVAEINQSNKMRNIPNKKDNSNEFNNRMYFEEYEDDSDDQYLIYHYFRTNQSEAKYFYQRYPIDIKNIRKKQQKKDIIFGKDDILYRKLSQKFQNNQKLVKNEYDSLQKVFCISYRDHLPVLLFATNLQQDIQGNIIKLFQCSNLLVKLRTEFVYFGIYKNMYPLEKWLQPYLKIDSDMNRIIIFRVNLYDQITIVSNISLKQSTQSILEAIKKAKTNCIKLNLDENYIRVKERMVSSGKYWKRPNNLQQRSKWKAEQKKLLSDQKLRRQQEQSYHQIHSIMNQNNKIKNNGSALIEKKIIKQQILEKRAEIRKNIKIYSEGISFKIRVPSGDNLFLVVPAEQKIKYLFDFVEGRSENLGFEDQLKRIFDLYIGFGDSRSLKQKKQQQIFTLFQQSAFLVVREIF